MLNHKKAMDAFKPDAKAKPLPKKEGVTNLL